MPVGRYPWAAGVPAFPPSRGNRNGTILSPGTAAGERNPAGPLYSVASDVPRYRFGEFILSPRRRVLLRQGRELPLIPRYFDLLVYLVARRSQAVHRRDIFDAVWADVAVSDSALSQAVRTLRRSLGDDSREPRFIRTVSRHGYQFVFAAVVEEDDEGPWPSEEDAPDVVEAGVEPPVTAEHDPFEPLMHRLLAPTATQADEEDRRDAAEQLHALGTGDALRRLGTGPRAAFARAMLRDARWDVPGAGTVPVLGAPEAATVAWHLVQLRFRRAFRIAAARWAAASLGAGLAGAIAGAAGGVLLLLSPGSAAPPGVIPVLAAIGAGCGAGAGAGVGAGLSAAESVARSARAAAVAAGGAAGGGLVGWLIQLLARASLDVLAGVTPHIGGAFEGLSIGAAAGLAYGATTSGAAGLATPRGRARTRIVALTAAACALAALLLTLTGHALVGGTVNLISQASAGTEGVLTPLGRLLGEPDFGPVTATLLGMGEGAAFGVGLTIGLTRRP